MPRIPLIEDLTVGTVPGGSNLMVQYDPASLWYDAALTIAGSWLRAGGVVNYFAASQPIEQIRGRLKLHGLDVDALEREDKLRIFDCYSATLGQTSNEKWALHSLKVGDLSIQVSKWMKLDNSAQRFMEGLAICDDYSSLARFNDEKSWVEFLLTRNIPAGRKFSAESANLDGYIRGVHSEWVYKRLEASYDGTVDFKFDDSGNEPRTLLRIRNMRNAKFDPRWRPIKLNENFEVILEE